MMRKTLFCFIILILLGSVYSCNNTPQGVLTPSQMENLLVEVHISEGLMEVDYGQYNTWDSKEKVMNAVLEKNHVTRAQFDTSLLYYGAHLEKYIEIYNKVVARLNRRNDALKQLIAESQQQTLTQRGDSVNIWKSNSFVVLQPYLMQGIVPFDITTDANFEVNDRFDLSFFIRSYPQFLSQPIRIYFAIEHSNDSIIYKDILLAKNGTATLSLESDTATSIRQIFGYFALTNPQYNQQDIYVDSIRLMRFHPSTSSN